MDVLGKELSIEKLRGRKLHAARLRRGVETALVIVSLGLGLLGRAAPAHAEIVRLADLQAHAMQQRPEIDENAARLRRSDASIEKATSAYRPSVSGGINASIAPGRALVHVRDIKDMDDYLVSGTRAIGDEGAFIPQPRVGVTVGVKGPLYDFGRTSAVIEAVRSQRSAVDADGKARAAAIANEVAAAYAAWAAAHSMYALAEESVRTTTAREQRVASLIEEGARPSIDRTSAAQETLAAQLELSAAAQALEAARLDLAWISAHELSEQAEPETAWLEKTAAGAPVNMTDTSERAIAAIEQAKHAALAEARAQDRSDRPVLGYSGEAGLQYQSANIFPVYSVGIGLSAPLYDGGASSAGAAEARAHAAELAAQVETERARDKHDVARGRAALVHVEQRVAMAREVLRLAELQVLQLSDQGSADADVWQGRVAAENSRLHARRELISAQVELVETRLRLAAGAK